MLTRIIKEVSLVWRLGIMLLDEQEMNESWQNPDDTMNMEYNFPTMEKL